ncbi:MAG: hypothetical protein ABSF51_05305, partial [Verrucomicrobiota bacterium]
PVDAGYLLTRGVRRGTPRPANMLTKNPEGFEGSIKSLQATATARSVLTVIQNLIIIIASEARLPWLCLSF